MTKHEIALMIAAFGALGMAGLIAQIIVRIANEKPQDNNNLPEQNDLPVTRPFGRREGR